MEKDDKEKWAFRFTLALVVFAMVFVWATMDYWSPPDICRKNGGEWDNWTVECVEKGQTTFDTFFPKKPDNCYPAYDGCNTLCCDDSNKNCTITLMFCEGR